MKVTLTIELEDSDEEALLTTDSVTERLEPLDMNVSRRAGGAVVVTFDGDLDCVARTLEEVAVALETEDEAE